MRNSSLSWRTLCCATFLTAAALTAFAEKRYYFVRGGELPAADNLTSIDLRAGHNGVTYNAGKNATLDTDTYAYPVFHIAGGWFVTEHNLTQDIDMSDITDPTEWYLVIKMATNDNNVGRIRLNNQPAFPLQSLPSEFTRDSLWHTYTLPLPASVSYNAQGPASKTDFFSIHYDGGQKDNFFAIDFAYLTNDITTLDPGTATADKACSEQGTTPKPQPVIPAAPQPDKDAANVIAFYSDAYTATGLTYNAGTNPERTNLAEGDEALHFPSANNYSIFNLGSALDLSQMDYLHVDVYAKGEARYQISPYQSTVTKITCDLTPNQWTGIDIPISAFTNVGDITKVDKLWMGEGAGEIYVDNIYCWQLPLNTDDTEAPTDFTAVFSAATYTSVTITCNANDDSKLVYTVQHNNTVILTQEAAAGLETALLINDLTPGTAYTFRISVADKAGNQCEDIVVVEAATLAYPAPAPAPTQQQSCVLSLFSDAYTPAVNAIWDAWWDWSTRVNTIQLADNDNAYMIQALGYATLSMEPALNLSDMEYLHLSVYPIGTTEFKVSPHDGSATQEYVTEITAEQWNELDIPLTAFSSLALDKVGNLWMGGNNAGTLFIDNIYYWKKHADNTADYSAANTPLYAYALAGNLYVKGANGETHLRITDLSGRTLLTATLNGDGCITLPATGILIVQLTDSQHTFTGKVGH